MYNKKVRPGVTVIQQKPTVLFLKWVNHKQNSTAYTRTKREMITAVVLVWESLELQLVL
jgi:hypothetical protein